MRLWQWIVVGSIAWIVLSVLVAVAWALVARALKRQHRRGRRR
jgi:hypothetical protein